MSDLSFSQAAFTKAAKQNPRFVTDGDWDDGALDFLQTFYDDAQQNDYLDLSKDALLDLATTLWGLGSKRKAGEKLIEAVSLDDDPQHILIGVVMDDQAFLVDSIIAAISSFGIEVHGLFHPIIAGYRSADGGWVGKKDGVAISESVVGVVIPRQTKRRREKLLTEIAQSLDDVSVINADFPHMLARLDSLADDLKRKHGETNTHDVKEAVAFLEWMRDGNFVLLGARTYDYGVGKKSESYSDPKIEKTLSYGVLRDVDTAVLRQSSEPSVISSNVQAFLKNAPLVSLAKSNLFSRVHRRVRMDYVTVKHFDVSGTITGETRIVGLLTSEAYSRSAWDIPLIRRKIERVLGTADVIQGSHKYNRLKYVLSSYPRDELFQIGETDLARIAPAVAQAFDRPRTRVFLRRDPFDRFVSVLVYTPREHYSTRIRARVGDYLAKTLKGRVSAFYPQYSDAPMARVHFIIGLDPDTNGFPDVADLEREIAVIVRPWEQGVISLAEDRDSDSNIVTFVTAFPVAYRDRYSAQDTLDDLDVLATLKKNGDFAVRALNLETKKSPAFQLKLYRRGERIEPSNIIPMLENFALHTLEETGYPIETKSGTYWVHDVETFVDLPVSCPAEAAEAFESALHATWSGQNQDDGFNRLILPQAASWRDIAFLRAVAAYRRQSGMDPAKSLQIQALETYPGLTQKLIALFHARFEPDAFDDYASRAERCDALKAEIDQGLNAVSSLQHDQVIRHIANVIATSLRTNFYQRDKADQPKPYISLKIDSGALTALPAPRPYREIYVSSPQVDGVHLRFGPIARGGLRWSDRRDDFRAEVLGLVKAQQVKNSVIVPVGSKGGFFPKQLPQNGTRDEVQTEAISAYTTFISGLLDLTDTYRGEDVIHPDATVGWDDDDPYLVVAADKGTATFSDTANGISQSYNFWLDDAFASGGSAGYDHKVMGITARGAWEAVKRHFREMGKDIQSQPFTVLGIGDMSGDVFGNGMLLSEQIQLRAAFNHMHIFIDPDPDTAKSFKERQRLFDKGRSSWSDYNTKLISKGGGIFERSAKSIILSDEMKEMTGLSKDEVTPDVLIHALLKMPIELLWFGGIGTYVKATTETAADVRDKANDAIRVNATELKAKVIGEGANLGVTQASRIEFARRGGRLNTDAVDNSAGVDSSDHEVNIKILLGGAIEQGSLKAKDRNALLEKMTDTVAELVLQHNYDQTGLLSLLESRADEDHQAYDRFMRELESRDALDRQVEGLPSPEEMEGRADEGLTRPEISVLVAYAKNESYKDLMATNFAEDSYYQNLLEAYFPPRLSKFETAMAGHRLRKEIIASRVINNMIDICGPLFLPRVTAQTRASIDDVADSFQVACEVLDVAQLREHIAALDNQVDASAQIQLADEIAQVIERVVAWMLRAGDTGEISERIKRRDAVRKIVDAAWLELLSPYDRKRAETRMRRFQKAGIGKELATDVALLRSRASSFDVIALAESTGLEPKRAAELFYRVGARFKIDRIRAALLTQEPESHWDALALRHIQEEMFAAQADFAGQIAKYWLSEDPRSAIEDWIKAELGGIKPYESTVQTLISERSWSVAKFSIISNLLQGLRERKKNTT